MPIIPKIQDVRRTERKIVLDVVFVDTETSIALRRETYGFTNQTISEVNTKAKLKAFLLAKRDALLATLDEDALEMTKLDAAMVKIRPFVNQNIETI